MLFFFRFPHAWRKFTIDMSKSLSSSTFYLEIFVFLIFMHHFFSSTAHSRPFFSAADPHIPTAHSRCYNFFWQVLVRAFFDFLFRWHDICGIWVLRSHLFWPLFVMSCECHASALSSEDHLGWVPCHVSAMSCECRVMWMWCHVNAISCKWHVMWMPYHVNAMSCECHIMWVPCHVSAVSCECRVMWVASDVSAMPCECHFMWATIEM